MKEVYLYRCEKCFVVMALEGDRGSKFYLDMCDACKEWVDFEKIVTCEGRFYVEGREDASKEGKVDER